MRSTFQYKAKISQTTQHNAFEWLNLCRRLYNTCLEQRIVRYRQHNVSISGYDQANELPELKRQLPEYKEVGSQCLQDVTERLNKAYQSFFRRIETKGEKAGFPRFQSRDRYNSFTLKNAGWKLDGRHLKIKGLGIFKLYLSRPIEGEIKTITIKVDACGDWYVSFSCDEVESHTLSATGKSIGIDVGINSFLTDSKGMEVANPRHFKVQRKKLRKQQRSLSRKKKGGGRRCKARRHVAKTYRKVRRQRDDFLHKVANDYVAQYDEICVEQLNIRNMIKNRRSNKGLRREISDVAWGKFIEMLTYKAEEAGRQLIKVDARNTSQQCSECGGMVRKSLSVRVHVCTQCGIQLDRDHNAALNILARGRQRKQSPSLSVGQTDKALIHQ